MATDPKVPNTEHGEGDHAADRAYRDHLERFQETHDVEELGREAKEDVERNPEPYREAVDAAKGGKPSRPVGPLPGEPVKKA